MKITDFIICDDIRTEAFNKVSLMGIYNDKISIQVSDKKNAKWPYIINLGLYVRIDASPSFVPADFRFSIEFLMDESSLGRIEGFSNKSQAPQSIVAIPVRIPQFPLIKEGVLKFKFSLLDINDGKKEFISFIKPINITLNVSSAHNGTV